MNKVKRQGSGWKGESRRHSLARKGIKTVIDDHRRLAVNNYVARGESSRDEFATGESLEAFLDTPLGEEYIEDHFESLFEVPFGGMAESEGLPYWIDNYYNNVTEVEFNRPEGDEYIENETGYYDRFNLGQNRTINNKEYYYAGTVGSSEELELQADNGELVYHNIGSNFFRIWKPIPKSHIVQEENDKFALYHEGTFIMYANDYDWLKNRGKELGYTMPNLYWDQSENNNIMRKD